MLVISLLHITVSYCNDLYKHQACHLDYYDHTQVDCSHQHLMAIPKKLPCDRNSIKELWLNLNKLEAVKSRMFKGFSKLKSVWLNSNNITTIEPYAFVGVGKLQYLDLGNNLLTKINRVTFKDLTLRVLNLRNNPISSLSDNAFHEQLNLEELYFSRCHFHELTNQMFSGLTKLQVLVLEKCTISSLQSYIFNKLQNLKTLSLAGNNLHNLAGISFQGLSKLEYLDLSSNNLKTVTTNLCTYASSLTTLKYSYNALASILFDGTYKQCQNLVYVELTAVMNDSHLTSDTFQGISNQLTDLQFNNNNCTGSAYFSAFRFLSHISLLNLRSTTLLSHVPTDTSIHWDNSEITKASVESLILSNVTVLQGSFILPSMLEYAIQPINKSSLQELDLSCNAISFVPNNTFENYTSLTILNLAHNMINRINVNAFIGLHKLKHLNLNDNYIWTIWPGTFNFSPNFPLISLILSENILALWQKGAFMGLKNLTTLNLADQGKLRIGREYFDDLSSIEMLDLSGNTMGNGFHLPLCNLLSLKILNVSHAWIHSRYEIPFDDMSVKCPNHTSHIQKLDFSASFIDDFSMVGDYMYDNHKAFENLQMLSVSSMTHFDMDYFPWKMFSHLSNLEYLKIKDNHITKIPKNVFANLTNLKHLDLSINGIASIEKSSWNGLTKLHTLDLHNNALDRIDSSMFSELTKLSYLYLDKNKYECSCGIITFFDYVKSTISKGIKLTSHYESYKNKPYWFQDFRCDIPNDLHEKSIIDVDPYQPIICDKYFILQVIISALLAGLCIIFIVFRLFRYEIKYYYFLLRLKCTCHAYEHLPEHDINYEYDINISCCDEDENWTLDNLLPYLENTLELKVHIKCRDLSPGMTKPSRIADLIWKHSRKTLFVISQNFIENGVCMYELTTAFQKLFDDSMNVMVFVNLDEIPGNKLPQILRFPLCKKNQNKWRMYTERTRDEFWHCLRNCIDRHPHVNHIWQIH
ncbi:uncharacterized protein LOC144451555 [Glandiceps talaboti]